MGTIKGSGIPGQYQVKMFYLRMRKYFLKLKQPQNSREEIAFLKEEEYKFMFLVKNGMVTKGHACSIILNISSLIETYGEMNTILQIESLNTLGNIVKTLVIYHRDYIAENYISKPKGSLQSSSKFDNKLSDLPEILLEDIVAIFTVQLEFENIKKQINDGGEILYRQKSLGNLLYIMKVILNFSQKIEDKIMTYAYLQQILINNDGHFQLEQEFINDNSGITNILRDINSKSHQMRVIALQTMVELCKDKS